MNLDKREVIIHLEFVNFLFKKTKNTIRDKA